jgi:23S rRNA pseudouridine1911/1915/1917 synthase
MLRKATKSLFLVHRLDKHTAGLVIVAKSKNAQQILMQQFQTGSAKRIYQGLVWGRVLNQVSVENDIGRDGKNPKNFRVYISGEKGGKHAVTHVKPI